jgi:hypothetical protein
MVWKFAAAVEFATDVITSTFFGALSFLFSSALLVLRTP